MAATVVTLLVPAAEAVGLRPPRRIKVRLKSDGSDQSKALQRAIDRAPNHAHLLLPAGRYRLDRRIFVTGRRGLVISGPKGRKKFVGYTHLDGFDVHDLSADRRYSYRAHWQVSRCRDVKLQRIHVEGPNKRRQGGFSVYKQDVEFEHAFLIGGASKRIRLIDCAFHQVNGDGIYVGGVGAPCRDIVVKGVHGRWCGRQQIAITNVDGLLIESVTISRGGRSGVDIEPNARSQHVRNVVLKKLDMGSRFYPYVVGGLSDIVRRENISLIDCTAHRSSSAHPAVQASRNGANLRIIRHRDDRQGSRYGVAVSGWDGVLVKDSKISSGEHTPISYGLGLKDCTGALRIIGNKFHQGSIGFDQLFEATGSTVALLVEHWGNVWGDGSLGDGDDPSLLGLG